MEKVMSPLRMLKDDIDPDLVVHLDDEDHLAIPVSERLLDYTERLLAAEITFAEVEGEWPDWLTHVEVFLAAYVLEELEQSLQDVQLGGVRMDQPMTPADEAVLQGVADSLSRHIGMRRGGEALVEWEDE